MLTVVLVGVAVSAFLNREVTRRLATVPPATTTTSVVTSTTFVPQPVTPRQRSIRPPVVAAPTTTTPPPTTAPPPAEVHQAAYDIITKLDALKVRDERPFGYGRYRFGAWVDEDGDGCTNRDDVIISQAQESVSRTNPCEIVSGIWQSLYDGATVNAPDAIVVDHVVGLAEAWRSGARDWTDAERNTYLNDVKRAGFVLAVSDASRTDKDGRDPSDWLP
ncbi:MAG: hypothetical protein QOI61_2142, partial [Actinomycetota bacterium]